uniref:Uncharacterized protein n=1 Tax=Arundo donax TaxID=35708 RepID=A0A0A8Y5Y7_ARUDO
MKSYCLHHKTKTPDTENSPLCKPPGSCD